MAGSLVVGRHRGCAFDANVLIYERIREELRNGAKPHSAIDAGYERAFLTIADANVTVLIGTLMLFAPGAGPVKGFAIPLAIGIVTSKFTAILRSPDLPPPHRTASCRERVYQVREIPQVPVTLKKK